MHRPRLRILTVLLGISTSAPGCGDDETGSGGGSTPDTSSSSATGTTSTSPTGSGDATTGSTTQPDATSSTDDTGSSGTGSTGGGTTGSDNAPPTPTDDVFATDEDIPLTIPAAAGLLTNDDDPDGDPLTVSAFDPVSAQGGAVSVGPDGGFTYTPSADFNGVDSFTYTADDGQGGATIATATIDVGPVQDAPTAVDDLYIVADDAVPLIVDAASGALANDIDVDADPLTATFDVATEAGGTVTGSADGSFVYTPPVPFWGEDGFGYVADDGNGGMAAARVRVVVSPTTVPLSVVTAGAGGFVIDGEAMDDESGASVSGAGDVNGDGLADLIVGARFVAPGGVSLAGRSYVVFGKPETTAVELSDVASGVGGFAVDGAAFGDYSGVSVSAAGDVNGDGLADLIVGAHAADAGGSVNVGRSYVVFGKSDTATVELSEIGMGIGGFSVDGDASTLLSGQSVSAAGDVDGDGLADVIIGAQYADAGVVVSPGRAYVVHGKTDTAAVSLADIAVGIGGFVLDGETTGDRAGRSVSAAGDVDGDGLADVIVGASRAAPGGLNVAGRSYVVFGKSDTAAVPLSAIANGVGGFVVDGESSADISGISVSGAGDVDGDGLADVIVGAPGADPGGLNTAGRSYVVFGKANTIAVALSDVSAGIGGFVVDGEAASEASGSSVSGAGDVDGDGLADVVIGAYRGNPPGAFGGGRSYVVFGKTDTIPVSLADISSGLGGFSLDGEAQNDRAGASVSGAGDVDGDGLADIIIGAYDASPNGLFSGRSYVVFGGNLSGAVTHRGTAFADALIGTPSSDAMAAGRGDDTVVGGGGADVLYCGPDDDIVTIPNGGFFRVDGGAGSDTLRLDAAGTALNLTLIPDDAVVGIETIDITGSGDNDLVLELRDLLWISASSNTLTIVGDIGDTLDADLGGGGFLDNGSFGGFTDYSNGILTLRVDDDLMSNVVL